VSEATKNLTEFYDDIELCYKVMGLTFSDTPDKVDRVYSSLVAEYTNTMKSAEPADRQTAKDNLEQTKELYERITGSMIYKDYAREYEKYKLLKNEQMQARKQKQEAEKEPMVSCPYCSKLIPAKQKKCIYCQGKILTPMEMLMAKVFITRNVIAAVAVLALVGLAVVMILNPDLLNSIVNVIKATK
jgi:hypothetical protein